MAIQKPRKSSSTAFKRLPRRVVNSSVQLSSFEAADLLDFTTLVAAIDYSKVANSTYDTLKTWAGTISRSLVDTVVTHKEPRVQALGRQASRRAIRMRQCFELEHVIRNYDLDFLAAQSYLEEYKRMEQELRPFEDKHFDKEWSLHRRIIKAAKAIGEVLAAQGLDKDLLNTATASSTTVKLLPCMFVCSELISAEKQDRAQERSMEQENCHRVFRLTLFGYQLRGTADER